MRQERPIGECTRWFELLATHLPELTRAQLRTLALWSFAATLTQHIASTTCAEFLARLFDQPRSNMRQRLREFYLEAPSKAGKNRLSLEVSACFAPLLRWILKLYRGEHLVLALDATLCRDRLAVLCVSVVFRGSALPVAWHILSANETGAWIKPSTELFDLLSKAVPEQERRPVLMLCDRGLMSRRLFEAIKQKGWHPVMRLTRQGCYRERGDSVWYRLGRILPGPGRYYVGEGDVFKNHPIGCTLIALWEEGQKEPWLLMTDLPAERLWGAFYGLRAWIEQGFRVMKSGAYRCERLRVTHPDRAQRIWLVLALSQLWTHAVGADASLAEEPVGLSPVLQTGVRRVLSVHRMGWIVVLVCAIRGEPLPLPERLVASPIPAVPTGTPVVLKPPS